MTRTNEQKQPRTVDLGGALLEKAALPAFFEHRHQRTQFSPNSSQHQAIMADANGLAAARVGEDADGEHAGDQAPNGKNFASFSVQLQEYAAEQAKVLQLTQELEAKRAKEADERELKREEEARVAAQEKAAVAHQAAIGALVAKARDLRKGERGTHITWAYVTTVEKTEERVNLATAVLEANSLFDRDLDADTALEEANQCLESAVKKIASLSKEKQDDLFKALKIRKPPAKEVITCGRCERVGHATNDCHAKTHGKTGEALGGAAAGRGSTGRYGRAPDYRESYGERRRERSPERGYRDDRRPRSRSRSRERDHGDRPRETRSCHNCHQVGHLQAYCKEGLRRVGRRESERRPRGESPIRASTHRTTMIGVCDSAKKQDTVAAMEIETEKPPSGILSEAKSETETQRATSRVLKEQDTLAGLYTDVAEKPKDASLFSSKSSPARKEMEEQLLESLELTGMPSKDRSLRQAIHAFFEGRKKWLGEVEVEAQHCSRCTKRGHTERGCPDQTQGVESDKGYADGWVRELMRQPRVRIAEVNKGLALEEGVRLWLERGAARNVGNPWAGSVKREDSLRRFLGYHQAMGMSAVHIGWIGFGVPLNFIPEKTPEVLAFKNHKSAHEEGEFVDKEHSAGLADGSFVEVTRAVLKGICPLQVEKHPTSGKLRMFQDLRWINGHLPNVEFRMESLHVELGDVVQPGDKLFTTDIEKAYYCLPLHPDARPYLGWQWRGRYFMPTCLVFGLSTAPRIFTKIMRPMMAFMRSLGVRVLGMIDDYMWAARPDETKQLRAAVRMVLPQLGWKLNDKCVWEPSDEVLMLGMLINTKEFVVRAPAKKIEAALHAIRVVLEPVRRESPGPPSLRSMQRITGLLMSMMLALPAVRVYTRAMYQVIAIAQEEIEVSRQHGRSRRGRGDPPGTVRLTRDAIEEMEFWLQRLLSHNKLRISSRENQVEVLLWSDASDVGWGGEAVGVVRGSSAVDAAYAEYAPLTAVERMQHGSLPRAEIANSSTRRELVGLLQLVHTPEILAQIQGRRVKVLMDSLPALRNLINGGGPVPNLTAAVVEWTQFCERYRVEPVYDWVPRAANWRADKASKLDSQQHSLLSGAEERIRKELSRRSPSATRTNPWRNRAPMFTPMFHQVDARVEMIRAMLSEAIIIVPEWPAGGANDWYRRLQKHSVARVNIGRVREVYKESSLTGHDEQLIAFFVLGRREEKRLQVSREQTERAGTSAERS